MNKNNFLKGAASTLDLFPSSRENTIHNTPTHSDEEAIKKDLEQIGNDMFFAVKSFSQEKKKN